MESEKAKTITDEEYLHKAQNGVCVLFEWLEFKFAEGDCYECSPEISYFIFCEDKIWLISESDMFELLKIYFVYNRKYRSPNIIEKLCSLGIMECE